MDEIKEFMDPFKGTNREKYNKWQQIWDRNNFRADRFIFLSNFLLFGVQGLNGNNPWSLQLYQDSVKKPGWWGEVAKEPDAVSADDPDWDSEYEEDREY